MITTGALIDDRSQEIKNLDWKHEEIASGFSPYNWEERPMRERYYYPYSQSSSLSCVAGGAAIILEHYDGNVVSRKDIYGRRVNYPNGGMMMADAFSIMKSGACLESTLISQDLGEKAMNERMTATPAMLGERERNRVGAYFSIGGFTNIDTIASVVKNVPVMMYWFFDKNGEEWWREYPTLKYSFSSEYSSGTTHHQVCIVDAILIGGKKYLVGQDTAGVGTGLGENNNLRLISEEVLKRRSYAGGYCLDDDSELLKPLPFPEKPKFSAKGAMRANDRGDSVRQLQNVLIYEGLLKIKAATGFYGGATASAVSALQEKYADLILVPAKLSKGTGIAGPRTLSFLREKYK